MYPARSRLRLFQEDRRPTAIQGNERGVDIGKLVSVNLPVSFNVRCHVTVNEPMTGRAVAGKTLAI